MNTNDKNRSQVKITPALLLAAQDKKHPLQSLKDLSLKDAVYLITLIRSAVIVTKENHIGPFTRVPTLVPYDIDIFLDHLIERKLITLSIQTKESAFTVVKDDVIDLDYLAAKWMIYLENFESTLLELNNLIVNSNWLPSWKHDVKAVWLEIAILECSEYLTYLTNERKFELDITDDITNNILTLLRSYSVSHCFTIMQNAAREASDRIMLNKLDKSEAGNNIVKYCLHAINYQNEYRAKSRPYGLPQSQLSYVFHYEFLKIGSAGFSDIPRSISHA